MAKVVDNYSDLDMSDDDDKDEVDLTFNKATNHLKNFVSKLDSATLLNFYAHFKQATEGKCNTPRPGWFDMQGKQKWDAWNSLGDMSRQAAKKIYIDLMKSVDPHFENSSGASTSSSNKGDSWVSVSTMTKENDDLHESEKSVFDRCQENNLEEVSKILTANPSLANSLDENGLGLIHWASDRGYTDMLQLLITHKCNVNLPDETGQTALHYAVSCCQFECIKILVENGALVDIKDEDGVKPIDLCSDQSIQLYLSNIQQ